MARRRPSAIRHLVDFLQDERWTLDEPPAGDWFLEAAVIGWTRDPFDRLLAAHAQLRRWRIATADRVLLEQLGPAAASNSRPRTRER